MPARPVFYSFRRCPYAMRARLALLYAEQAVELREVVLKNKPLELLAVSAKSTVPVLVIGDQVLDESLDIMQWALQENDPDQWLNAVQGSLLNHALVQANDHEFKPLLDQYKYHDRHPDSSQEETLQKTLPYLNRLEHLLEQHHGFLAGNTFSALDVAIFPFIRQFAHSDLSRFEQLNLPKLQIWLSDCIESSLFKGIMRKYQPWSAQEGNAVIFAS